MVMDRLDLDQVQKARGNCQVRRSNFRASPKATEAEERTHQAGAPGLLAKCLVNCKCGGEGNLIIHAYLAENKEGVNPLGFHKGIS